MTQRILLSSAALRDEHRVLEMRGLDVSLHELVLEKTIDFIESSELNDSEKKLLVSLIRDTLLLDSQMIEETIKRPVDD